MITITRLLLISLVFICFTASARTPVYVAAYDFPPFFSDSLESDVTTELVELLNRHQRRYEFIIQAIPPQGRYQALSADGCCQVVFFESESWGWKNHDVEVEMTAPILRGRERLVAKKTPGIDQSYFDDLTDKTLGGVRGYHYILGGEPLSSEEVARQYRVYLSDSRITNLRMLLGGRLDVTMLNDELLAALENAPQHFSDNLYQHDEIQSTYTMGIVVAPNKGISAGDMQLMLRQLAREGLLDSVLLRFNLDKFQIYRR